MTQQKSSEELREDINTTRARLGSTVDSIQEQLRPERLREQAQVTIQETLNDSVDSAVDYVRTHRQELGSSIAETIKRNPVPSLLVGAGIGWLLIDAVRDPSNQSRPESRRAKIYSPSGYGQNLHPEPPRDMRYGYDDPAEYGSGNGSNNPLRQVADSVQEKAVSATDTIKSGAEQAINTVQTKAAEVGSTVRNEAQTYSTEARHTADQWGAEASQQVNEYQQQFSQQASQIGDTVQEQTAQASQQARQAAQQAQHQVQQSINDNPLLYSAVALGAGALIGLLLPETRAENRLMGETSDQVMATARGAASDVVDRVQNVAQEVKPEIEQAAKQAMEEVKQSGQETLNQMQNKTEETIKTEGEKAKEDVKDRVQTQ